MVTGPVQPTRNRNGRGPKPGSKVRGEKPKAKPPEPVTYQVLSDDEYTRIFDALIRDGLIGREP